MLVTKAIVELVLQPVNSNSHLVKAAKLAIRSR